MNTKKAVGPALVIAFLATLYSPTFIWLVRSWLSNPYYGHGFLIPLVSGFFVWRNRGQLKRAKPSHAGVMVLILGLSVYVAGFALRMHFLLALSLLIVLTGLSLYFFSGKATRSLMFPVWFLIFMIPLPFLNEIDYRLQSFSARVSAAIVKAIGIPVSVTGAEISLENSSFVIGLPCSGMNTLISLLALAAVFGYVLTGPLYKKGILFMLALPIAILANAFRIVLLLLVADHFGTEAATGFFHGFSSLLLFLVAFLLLVLLSRLLRLSFRGPVSGGR